MVSCSCAFIVWKDSMREYKLLASWAKWCRLATSTLCCTQPRPTPLSGACLKSARCLETTVCLYGWFFYSLCQSKRRTRVPDHHSYDFHSMTVRSEWSYIRVLWKVHAVLYSTEDWCEWVKQAVCVKDHTASHPDSYSWISFQRKLGHFRVDHGRKAA